MKMAFFILISLALTGCNQGSPAVTTEKEAEIAPQTVLDHYYSLKDGYDYGYEQGLSEEAIQQGQAATSLLMFKYAGQKNGIYQVYSKDSDVSTVIECSNPCDFMKIMVFAKGIGHIKTERMRATNGTIGWSVIADAINGKLEQFQGAKNDKKFTVWFDEKDSAQFDYIDTKQE